MGCRGAAFIDHGTMIQAHLVEIRKKKKIIPLQWSVVWQVVGLCLFITLLVPRAASVLTTVVILYLPFPMLAFFWLLACYVGCVLQKLEGRQVPLQGPPLCCVCCCCPRPPFTRYTLPPHLYFFIWSEGTIRELNCEVCDLQLNLTSLSPYLLCLNALSFFLGMYGLVIFTRMAAAVLDGFYVRGKFLVLQLHFILVRFQFLLFDLLAKLEMTPCHPPAVSPAVSAIYVRSALLLGEGFVLAVLSRLFFLHPPPYSFQHHVPATTDS
ncbi:hypothetical protein LAZ67_17002993 [Cordylochernes scorpioides]|uniref:Uncharacterized protein n=1 Tax=Cordylochernes scorpioides TaxID=51811 RepID=A0ABY6LGG4_9ARAC|nr:hypothetical protein LAZ67_17002993 [Cordylochernes scorpioides]